MTTALETLKTFNQWLCWKDDGGKIPKSPHANRNGSSTNPETWSDYATAAAAVKRFGYTGVGFVFTKKAGIIGIDLDDCLDDAGNLTPWAAEIVTALDSYTELSPSKRGLHIYVCGSLPGNGLNTPTVEMYDQGRYFTWTGNHWPETPESINHRESQVTKLYQKLKKQPQEPSPPSSRPETNGHYPKRTQKALDTILGNLVAAKPKTRNTTLNRAAFSLGGFVGRGDLAKHEAERMLTDVGLALGLGEHEVEKTIRSGLQAGIAAPFTDETEPVIRDPLEPPDDNGHTPPNSLLIEGADDKDKELSWIQTNARHHREVAGDAYQALVKGNNPPCIFVRDAKLVRVRPDESETPVIEIIKPESLHYHLDKTANYFTRRHTQNGPSDTKGTIPMSVVKNVLSFPEWPDFPALAGVVNYPFFTPEGELIATSGYNERTRTYYYPDNLAIGDTEPTGENVAKAKRLILDDLLIDFPFVDEASRTHAVAIALLPFVRPAIEGPTPLHMIDAPTPGSGKSLMASLLAQIAAKDGAMSMTAVDNEEEWRKRLIAALLTGKSHIIIDNIPQKLVSSMLAAALTFDRWTERNLGGLENVTTTVRAVFIGTGNNSTAHGELARRTVWSRIDARVEMPWKRTQFKHQNILEWAKTHRSEIVTACLTLCRLWFETGQPDAKHRLGSYEAWSQVIGGILTTAGFEDFLGNADEMYEKADTDRLPWVAFVEKWYEAHGYNRVGTDKLFPIASVYDALPGTKPEGLNLLGEFVEGPTNRSRQSKLGRLLRKNIDRVFGEYRIVEAGKSKRLAQYKLEPARKLF